MCTWVEQKTIEHSVMDWPLQRHYRTEQKTANIQRRAMNVCQEARRTITEDFDVKLKFHV